MQEESFGKQFGDGKWIWRVDEGEQDDCSRGGNSRKYPWWTFSLLASEVGVDQQDFDSH